MHYILFIILIGFHGTSLVSVPYTFKTKISCNTAMSNTADIKINGNPVLSFCLPVGE